MGNDPASRVWKGEAGKVEPTRVSAFFVMARPLEDSFGRPITDLRISVTDKCNFRCVYCKPEQEFVQRHRDQLLTFEEIERLVSILAPLGVRKIRITGGEPLLRRGIEKMMERIKAAHAQLDLAMTTNAFYLKDRLPDLVAVLSRINISCDSLRRERFFEMTKVDCLDRVLEAIDLVRQTPIRPIKVNAVVIRGFNDDEVEDFVHFARQKDIVVRFIEFMPLDSGHSWGREQVVPSEEIIEKIARVADLVELPRQYESETAVRYGFVDGRGEVGVIAPVTQPFCAKCGRLRLTADGHFRTCLFSLTEQDVKAHLRNGSSDAEIEEFVRDVVWKKEERHHINDSDFVQPARSMSFIGG